MDRVELKLQTFMAVAAQISQLGTCDRKRVGAVFIRDGRCISWGFNGAPEGLPHCEDNNHGWLPEWEDAAAHYQNEKGEDPHEAMDSADQSVENWIKDIGCKNATHAEANALAFAARSGISTDKSTLFVTVSPCGACARLLIASGVKTIYYLEEYRDTAGLELIREAGGTAICLQRDHGSRDPG